VNASAGPGLAGLDLASIPDLIQSEVQRAIQRSIKGVPKPPARGIGVSTNRKNRVLRLPDLNLPTGPPKRTHRSNRSVSGAPFRQRESLLSFQM